MDILRTNKIEVKVRKVLIRIVFMLIVTNFCMLAVPADVSASTITVPDDYPTIQQAVNAAIAGDTIFVRSGTYYEHVAINKPLKLQGVDKNDTIINAGGSGNAISLIANSSNITIERITATNGRYGIYFMDGSITNVNIRDSILTSNIEDGIHGRYGKNVIHIEDCELSYNGGCGIWAHHFNNSLMINCHVFENAHDPSQPHRTGITMGWCYNTSIVDCYIVSNETTGIIFDSTWQCQVIGCDVQDNGGTGIYIYRWGYGFNNTVRDNIVRHNGRGIQLHGGNNAYNNLIYHNDIISNGIQALDYDSRNRWDNGYPSGGNYWSDYTGVDSFSGPNQDVIGSDGIGDTPYDIYTYNNIFANRDFYPLIKPLHTTYANAGPDQTVELDSYDGAYVTLDGSGSSDPDGDPLTYFWTWDGETASGVSPTIILPLGTTTITLVVNDGTADSEPDTVDITVVDTTPPDIEVIVPVVDTALQDGVTLTAEASDYSGIDGVYFYIREDDGGSGIPIGPAYENIPATFISGQWVYWFETTSLPDGYYIVFAQAVDSSYNEGWSKVIPCSIRNWAILELLPASESNKAGRTMPVKFSLRIAEAVDAAMPFVYNESLEILIYEAEDPGTILQLSQYGNTSTDYRINILNELYITNFKTMRKPADYVVEIWRMSTDFLVDSFAFETVK